MNRLNTKIGVFLMIYGGVAIASSTVMLWLAFSRDSSIFNNMMSAIGVGASAAMLASTLLLYGLTKVIGPFNRNRMVREG